MNQVIAENLVEFVRKRGSLELTTEARKKSFMVRATDNGLEIVPGSSKKVRNHKLPVLRRVCEKFSETHSFRSGDYRNITANPSYSVAILRAYLGQGACPQTPNAASLEAFQADQERELRKAWNDSAESRRERLAAAAKTPPLRLVTAVVVARNPDVIVEVLLRANGRCEECGVPAPFIRRSDNSPYLEVHHRVQLALGGADTVENAMALCPNCHRRKHYE